MSAVYVCIACMCVCVYVYVRVCVCVRVCISALVCPCLLSRSCCCSTTNSITLHRPDSKKPRLNLLPYCRESSLPYPNGRKNYCQFWDSFNIVCFSLFLRAHTQTHTHAFVETCRQTRIHSHTQADVFPTSAFVTTYAQTTLQGSRAQRNKHTILLPHTHTHTNVIHTGPKGLNCYYGTCRNGSYPPDAKGVRVCESVCVCVKLQK